MINERKGFGRCMATSCETNKTNKKSNNTLNIILTIIFILLAFTIYLQGCTVHVHPKRAEFKCEFINDYEVICKNA